MNPTITYQLAVLRQDELRREADRHRIAASGYRRTRSGFPFLRPRSRPRAAVTPSPAA